MKNRKQLFELLLKGEIALAAFRLHIDIINHGGSLPLSYWVKKIQWTDDYESI